MKHILVGKDFIDGENASLNKMGYKIFRNTLFSSVSI
jgi:hypothetical protein